MILLRLTRALSGSSRVLPSSANTSLHSDQTVRSFMRLVWLPWQYYQALWGFEGKKCIKSDTAGTNKVQSHLELNAMPEFTKTFTFCIETYQRQGGVLVCFNSFQYKIETCCALCHHIKFKFSCDLIDAWSVTVSSMLHRNHRDIYRFWPCPVRGLFVRLVDQCRYFIQFLSGPSSLDQEILTFCRISEGSILHCKYIIILVSQGKSNLTFGSILNWSFFLSIWSLLSCAI